VSPAGVCEGGDVLQELLAGFAIRADEEFLVDGLSLGNRVIAQSQKIGLHQFEQRLTV
jgi:hypothetical protein